MRAQQEGNNPFLAEARRFRDAELKKLEVDLQRQQDAEVQKLQVLQLQQKQEVEEHTGASIRREQEMKTIQDLQASLF